MYIITNIFFIRRADQLIQEDKDDVIPYCIAVGDVKKLVNFFMSRGQLKEALLVAQVKPLNMTMYAFMGRVTEEIRLNRLRIIYITYPLFPNYLDLLTLNLHISIMSSIQLLL